MNDFISMLYNQNPWWVSKDFGFEEASYPKRDMFYTVMGWISAQQIIGIVGLRRTGKTTILKQVMNELLKDVPPKNILFFSFDEEFIARKSNILENILFTYIEQILGKKIWDVKKRVYIFLDEVQYVPFWQDIVKRLYDQNKNLKFIVSGSASLFISKKSKESLAGRIFELDLAVLSFREFLKLKGESISLPRGSLFSFDFKEAEEFFYVYRKRAESLFTEYLIGGNFPEVIGEFDTRKTVFYLKDSILAKILEYDLPMAFNIEKKEEMRALFRIVATESGNLFEFQNVAEDLKISRDTVADYIGYFEKAYIAHLCYNFTRSMRKQLRTKKKIFVASPNFTCAILGINLTNPLFKEIIGHLVETSVFNTLKGRFDRVFFWKEREKEVNFVVCQGEEIYPIEVKYTGRIRLKDDIKWMLSFMEKKNLKKGFLFTKDTLEVIDENGKQMILLPVWML